MAEIDTDYLVVGAGASAMAFVDSLIAAQPNVDVVLVDKRDRPGGHWLDAYPFVRLHQPSANYGVASRVLGGDRIDDSGPNAGFYERATAPEIVDYFGRVLDDDFLASGRVRFLGGCEHRGVEGDGHHVVSLASGEATTVRVRRKVVDATYVESTIPSRHTPSFAVDPDVRVIPPNDLVDLGDPGGGFTVMGGGKTAMDTCNWLLDSGVDADAIEWIRPRDPWLFDRAAMQPLELVGSYMHLQASWVAAAAEAEDGADFARRLEADGILMRIDPATEPTAFRGAIISRDEISALRTIERVVRARRVTRVESAGLVLDGDAGGGDGAVGGRGRVHVDCTAAGVRTTTPVPIFAPDRITLQYVTIGIVPWGAATLGFLEGTFDDDEQKNRLAPVVLFGGGTSDLLRLAHQGMSGQLARGAEPTVAAWMEGCRLNPARGAADHLDDSRVGAAFESLGRTIGPAMANLENRRNADDR